MSSLAQYHLVLPPETLTKHDWAAEIKAAEGQEKRLLQMQELALHTVDQLDPIPLTAEKLAWAVLWTRCFVLLEAAVNLHGTLGGSAAGVLDRVALELWLQVESILDPVEALNSLSKLPTSTVRVSEERKRAAWDEVSDRLRAYATWALTNDLVNHRRRLAKQELRLRHHATDPARIPKTAHELALRRYFLGELEIVSEAEARLDREQDRDEQERSLERISDWLSEPTFGNWPHRLAPWIRGDQNDTPPSFFALLDEDSVTLMARLQAMVAPHLYRGYAEGSMLLHGSSVFQFIVAEDDPRVLMAPFLLGPEATNAYCMSLADTCQIAMVPLLNIAHHCLRE